MFDLVFVMGVLELRLMFFNVMVFNLIGMLCSFDRVLIIFCRGLLKKLNEVGLFNFLLIRVLFLFGLIRLIVLYFL